jgi:hypothetical protein
MIFLSLDVRIFRQGNEKNILHDCLCDLVMTSALMYSDAYCRSRTWVTSAPFTESSAVTWRLSCTLWQSDRVWNQKYLGSFATPAACYEQVNLELCDSRLQWRAPCHVLHYHAVGTIVWRVIRMVQRLFSHCLPSQFKWYVTTLMDTRKTVLDHTVTQWIWHRALYK